MAIQAHLYSENIAFGGPPPHDLLFDNACGINNFCFLQQQQQKRQKIEPFVQFDQFQNLNYQNKNGFLVENSMNVQESMAFPQNVSAQFDKQRMEIGRFITLQNERLRLSLQHQRRQELALFLQKYEENTEFLLKQKDEQIAKELNRAMELQEFVKRKEFENQTLQRMAKEKEAMVASLNGTIERLRESACALSSDDAESCCEGEREEMEEQRTRKMVCKCCNNRSSCVIMLPCRHMCSCKDCEAFLDFCPVCRMVKKGSIEALI